MKVKFQTQVVVLGVVSSEGHVMPPFIFKRGLKVKIKVYISITCASRSRFGH
uniref:Uncharacterized protein n=1 Tax=Lepeophtheirus salmonis TaxID=72036 RepID=A0A0K2TP90_LEPSM